MLHKVKKIIEIQNFAIICEFNTGAQKKIEVLPLLLKHSHLKGIQQLNQKSIFDQVAIGEMGELFWKNVITSKSNEIWNYDISPEFIYHFGINVND